MTNFGTLNDPVLQFVIVYGGGGLLLLVAFAVCNHILNSIFGWK